MRAKFNEFPVSHNDCIVSTRHGCRRFVTVAETVIIQPVLAGAHEPDQAPDLPKQGVVLDPQAFRVLLGRDPFLIDLDRRAAMDQDVFNVGASLRRDERRKDTAIGSGNDIAEVERTSRSVRK